MTGKISNSRELTKFGKIDVMQCNAMGELASFIINPKFWKKTQKKGYNVYACMPKIGTQVVNKLEGAKYATDSNKRFVLSGTVGEQWVIDVGKMAKTYSFADGSPITPDALKRRMQGDVIDWIQLKTLPGGGGLNWAFYLPANIMNLPVKTSWGDTLMANRPGVEHGVGDFLVCSDAGGKPNLSDMWVVNGQVFPNTYDMRAFPGLVPQKAGVDTNIPKPNSIMTGSNVASNNDANSDKVAKIKAIRSTVRSAVATHGKSVGFNGVKVSADNVDTGSTNLDDVNHIRLDISTTNDDGNNYFIDVNLDTNKIKPNIICPRGRQINYKEHKLSKDMLVGSVLILVKAKKMIMANSGEEIGTDAKTDANRDDETASKWKKVKSIQSMVQKAVEDNGKSVGFNNVHISVENTDTGSKLLTDANRLIVDISAPADNNRYFIDVNLVTDKITPRVMYANGNQYDSTEHKLSKNMLVGAVMILVQQRRRAMAGT